MKLPSEDLKMRSMILLAALCCSFAPATSFAEEPAVESAQPSEAEQNRLGALLLRCARFSVMAEMYYLSKSFEAQHKGAQPFSQMTDAELRTMFPILVDTTRSLVSNVRKNPDIDTTVLDGQLEKSLDDFDFPLVASELGRIASQLETAYFLAATVLKNGDRSMRAYAPDVVAMELTPQVCRDTTADG